MIEWIKQNAEWLFGGIGVSALGALLLFVRRWLPREKDSGHLQLTISTTPPVATSASSPSDDVKQRTRILFIDDDTTFRVVKIIRGAGWHHTKIVKDVKAVECPEIREATILFVDVQGVGRALGFTNEGLGLALAIKKKYPDKKVVIYSAQTSGDRFDEALRKADDFLAKNADPYEFLALVDRLSSEA